MPDLSPTTPDTPSLPSTPSMPSSPRPGRPTSGARGHWALRDRPGIVWMILAVLVALAHPFIAESRWLMVHLVLLGALTHSIMVWSTHFTQALLKTRPGLDDRKMQSRRLILLLIGTSMTLVGVPTAQWWLTVIGASLVSVAVLWHGVQLWRRLRAALPVRFRITIRYYLAAAICLPVGAGLGATLALGLDDATHGRILLAHTMVNVLGWIGLTVTGTLLTLWPTVLRTQITPKAEGRATQALPGLITALVLLVAGALVDLRWLSLAALGLYAVSLLWWASAVLAPVRTKLPREFAPASVGLALIWWLVGIGYLLVRLATTATWADFADGFGQTSAIIVVGFAAQLLSGALSYLVPSVLGGGKTVVRAGQKWLDRWATARLVTINAGLALSLLPIPSLVRVIISVLVLIALAAFIPLLFRGIAAAATARRALADGPRPIEPRPSTNGPDHLPSIWSGGQLVAAVSALALAISIGVAGDPAAAGLGGLTALPGQTSASAPVAATGETTTVTVKALDMLFEPSSVEVPAGNRLVINLVNEDPTNVHDLQLMGQRTPRLPHGGAATLDLGIVTASTQGWCTIVGHRQMGMVFDVVAVGGSDSAAVTAPGGDAGHQTGSPGAGAAYLQSATPLLDPDAVVQDSIDPVLAPASEETVHKLTLTAQELELEVAPGITQTRWTFNGQAPGPTLHGRVGDIFEITLVNDGTMGHSIDFHAGALAPDRPMRTIAPGESLVYRFTATRAGIWMYHCSTMPMTAHIAAGMFGAVVIEPEGGLPAVDREYLLVQSEVYLQQGTGDRAAGTDAAEVDADAVLAERPSLVTFNGIANQYDQEMLTAKVGERVRIWVLDAGPNRPTSFHIVGGQFDTVYSEGAYLLGPQAQGSGSQVLGLQAAQGGFVELTFPEPGHYPMVSHIMVDAERGAHGFVRVTE